MENSKAVAVRDWDQNFINMMRLLTRYVNKLQATLPKDALNRPLGLTNPQVILGTGFKQSADVFIDNPPTDAVFPVSYLEGLPTINGIPIWEKLEGEKVEYYDLFKQYRNMSDDKNNRTIYKLSTSTGIPVSHLELLRQAFNWQIRVKAYDEYVMIERAHELEIRRREIESKHASAGNKLFKMCLDYLQENVQLLTPKTALEAMDLAIRMERISAGLLPDRPGTTSGDARTTVNIQNNVGTPGAITSAANGTGSTGDVNEDKDRLKKLVNIMNNVGLLDQKEPEKQIIDVDSEDVDKEGE